MTARSRSADSASPTCRGDSMKISDEMRFAHPVLSRATADFLAGEFNFDFEVEERTSDGRLRLSYSCDITEETLQKLVRDDLARIGLFVLCGDTYFSQLRNLSFGKSVLEFEGGLLNGRVVLRPLLWTECAMDQWRPTNVHPEFGSGVIPVGLHKLLGIGDEFVVHVGQDKLRPLETIFTLAVSDEMVEGRIGLDMESEKIRIVVDRKTHASISLYRGNNIGKAILLNGVYLPAVMEVLRNLSSEKQLYEQYRWYRPFVAKCEHLSIDLSDPPLLQDAQKLLLDPYRRLMDRQEKIMS
jgi:hypothetical protein